MMSSLVIPKKKDGKVWNETIPFNPTLFGWDFVKACCCEADFVNGEMKMKVAKQKPVDKGDLARKTRKQSSALKG